jgi:hypothetical protein
MLATILPIADAQLLSERLINFAVNTNDHALSDEVIKILRIRKSNDDDLDN